MDGAVGRSLSWQRRWTRHCQPGADTRLMQHCPRLRRLRPFNTTPGGGSPDAHKAAPEAAEPAANIRPNYIVACAQGRAWRRCCASRRRCTLSAAAASCLVALALWRSAPQMPQSVVRWFAEAHWLRAASDVDWIYAVAGLRHQSLVPDRVSWLHPPASKRDRLGRRRAGPVSTQRPT